MINGGQAFPVPNMELHGEYGMTLRDYFAAQAMQAEILHNGEESEENIRMNCVRAYQYADAMLKARES